jgi:hypothetical protein
VGPGIGGTQGGHPLVVHQRPGYEPAAQCRGKGAGSDNGAGSSPAATHGPGARYQPADRLVPPGYCTPSQVRPRESGALSPVAGTRTRRNRGQISRICVHRTGLLEGRTPLPTGRSWWRRGQIQQPPGAPISVSGACQSWATLSHSRTPPRSRELRGRRHLGNDGSLPLLTAALLDHAVEPSNRQPRERTDDGAPDHLEYGESPGPVFDERLVH